MAEIAYGKPQWWTSTAKEHPIISENNTLKETVLKLQEEIRQLEAKVKNKKLKGAD